MRFAGEKVIKSESRRSYDALQDKPVVSGFNAEDLVDTPEMAPGKYFSGQDLMRDKYIQKDPRSGVSMLPNGEQGPSQGPNIPIKNYDGQYMPNGSEPSGYKAGPNGLMAFSPTMMKLQLLKQAIEGQPVNPGTRMSPKTEQEIYEPELTAPQKIESPNDRNYMEVMKSGFV